MPEGELTGVQQDALTVALAKHDRRVRIETMISIADSISQPVKDADPGHNRDVAAALLAIASALYEQAAKLA